MDWPYWLLLATILSAAWTMGVLVNRRRVRAFDGSGDPDAGVIVFVEPIRWLFIIWGFPGFCRGLRQSGCQHQIHLLRWCSPAGALLVIPDLVRRNRLLKKARRLARRVDRFVSEHPGRSIYLVGYSSGCYVTLEACRRIQCFGSLGPVILLAGAVGPGYSWDGLEERAGKVFSFHSKLDLISSVGPLLFGSNDRRWGPACGTVGFRNPPSFVIQRGWRLADIRLGYLGDHFSIASSRFVKRHIAPILTNEENHRKQTTDLTGKQPLVENRS